jgi:integrase
MVNEYTGRIVRIFSWGVEEEYVDPNTALALKAVKALPEGYPGTFENEERKPVPDEVIRRTLPFMPPTLAALVQVQRLTGCRPGEVFNMRVGEIDKNTDSDLWLYHVARHKTEKKTKRKKVIPLGKPEQLLLEPFLTGKKPDAAVFSPRQAVEERNAERRANRKSKITPSQAARDAARAAKPRKIAEFYNKDSYRQAVEYAINKGNKTLPEDEQIPYWAPYQMRHTAATAMELERIPFWSGHKSGKLLFFSIVISSIFTEDIYGKTLFA